MQYTIAAPMNAPTVWGAKSEELEENIQGKQNVKWQLGLDDLLKEWMYLNILMVLLNHSLI